MTDVVISSPFPDVLIDSSLTFPDFVRQKLTQYKNNISVINSVDGKKYTNADLLTLADKFQTSLGSLLQKGDVVSLCLTNCVEILPLAMALTSFGAIFNTSNPNYTVDELLYQYRLVKSKYLITNSDTAEKVKQVKLQCPDVKDVIVIDDKVDGCLNLYDLLASPQNISASPVDVAFLFSSSGTTGLPKQIMLTHSNLVANLSQLSPNKTDQMQMFCPGEKDLVLSVFPYFHLAGLLNGLVWVVKEGGCSIILPKYHPNTFLNVIETFKPNILIAPPPIHVFLTKSPLVEKADLSSLKTVVNRAAPIAPSVVEALCKRLNLDYVVNGYGMTELSTIGLIIPVCEKSHEKFGSCGVPLPNSKCKVVNPETGQCLGPNERGQLMIKGLNVCKGYLYNEQATKEAISEDGWLSTGDICYYDEDGYFYIVDRIKEMIKVKGFQVAPAEVEQCLLRHPDIADVAVVGILDEYAGELPFAFVVKKLDEVNNVTETEVKKFVADKLAKYKHLAGVKFVESIPKNPSGKILRRVLRDEIRREMAEKEK